MESVNTATPAFVLPLGNHGALGLVRSLGRLGVDVYAVHHRRWAPPACSRYCRKLFSWSASGARADGSIEFLLDVARELGQRAVLIPTNDHSALFVTDHAEALGEGFIFPRQPPALPRTLSSKAEMYRLCRRIGIPTAETSFPQSFEELSQLAPTTGFPAVIKAVEGYRVRNIGQEPVAIVSSQDELLDMYRKMDDGKGPNLVLQEYIPGGADSVWMFNGYFNAQSECLLGITGKKLRQTPVDTGMTSLGICTPNPEVEELTKRFMKAVGYRGILDMGYRYDERDHVYKVLDVNPRIGATFRLFAARGGLDVARALYLDLTGQRVPVGEGSCGRKWVIEDEDFISFLKYRRDGRITLREWLRSFRGVEEVAWFAGDDWLPFVMVLAKFPRRVLRRVLRAVKRQFLTRATE